MEKSIGQLEQMLDKVSLNAANEIYTILEDIEKLGVIEAYRLILEIIVKDILKQ